MKPSTERVRRFRARERRQEDQALLRAFWGWLRFQRVAESSAEAYHARVRCMAGRLAASGGLLAAQTPDLLAAWPKVGPDYHNGLIGALSHFYTFAKQQGIRDDDPTATMRKRPKPRRLPRPYLDEERTRYLQAARGLSARHYAVACLGVFAGLRIHEAAKLEWAEVGVNLTITGKGDKQRRVPVAEPLRAALEGWREECASKRYVFPQRETVTTPDRLPVKTLRLRRMHYEILKAGGLYVLNAAKGVNGFHRTRHTAGTAVYRGTRDLLLTQRFLGHSSHVTTAVYVLVADEEGEDNIRRALER